MYVASMNCTTIYITHFVNQNYLLPLLFYDFFVSLKHPERRPVEIQYHPVVELYCLFINTRVIIELVQHKDPEVPLEKHKRPIQLRCGNALRKPFPSQLSEPLDSFFLGILFHYPFGYLAIYWISGFVHHLPVKIAIRNSVWIFQHIVHKKLGNLLMVFLD